MLSAKDYITELLDLKNVFVSNIETKDDAIEVHIGTHASRKECPCCNKPALCHGYRKQVIKDIPYNNKPLYLVLKKRRFNCKGCGKTFFESYNFLPKYHHMTTRVYVNIWEELRRNFSMKSVAKRYNVSTNTVTRVFSLIQYNLTELPETIAIDEFKGNTDNEKYQAILTNPHNRKVLDIMPTREKTHLIDYFKAFKGREKVKYFVMDMWEPYRDIAESFFPNAKIVVDKYHYVRQVYWALDKVRRRVQKEFVKTKRIYFKNSRRLLFREYKTLNEEKQEYVRRMLDQSEDLRTAWELKELFIHFRKCKDLNTGKKELHDWILTAVEANLPEFKDATTAFSNWFQYILNSLECPLTNAFTEGTNNKIKVLKRNAYGFRNFSRFRNRILHHCS